MALNRRFSVNGTGKGEEDNNLPERHLDADQALDTRYKRLAEKWAAAEKYFRFLHLPEPIMVGYDLSKREPMWGTMRTSSELLGFIRFHCEWRLCHAICPDPETGDEIVWKPVVDCATHVRIEAASQLAKLKVEAAKVKEAYIARADEAIGEIDNLLSDD